MNTLENNLSDLFNNINNNILHYDELNSCLRLILDDEHVNRKIIYSFLNIFHLPIVLKTIVKNNSQDYWISNIVNIIIKHRFNTGQLIKQRVDSYKEKTLFITIDGDIKTNITYNKFWNDIILAGKSIEIISKNKDTVIGILSYNQYKSAMIDLCCLSFGFRVIPIPLNSTSEHLSYIINESKITHLFIGGEKATQLWNTISRKHDTLIIDINNINNVNEQIISWENFHDLGESNNEFDYQKYFLNQDMNWTNTIMYTSGSTSNPKGVRFNQINIISKRFARALALPDISSSDIFLCYLPLFHTFGRYFELMGSIFWGATYAFAESPSFNSLLKDFKIITPSIFISIPKRWVQLYELIDESIDLDFSKKDKIKEKVSELTGGNLNWGLSAAGYLDPDIFKFFHNNDIELISGYGMTEATGGITMTPPNEYTINSVGKALPGIDLKLAEDGELCMRGPYISEGFFNIKESESFKNGWFHSGDIFKEKNGHYFILDRKKDIYKNSRGQTIAPQKIENLFQDFDLIKSVYLVGDGREYNTVLIYPNKSNLPDLNKNEIHEVFTSMLISVNSFLSPFERIVSFTIIDRDFDKNKNELTQKGTFKRNNILKNFDSEIKLMYKKNYISLRNQNKEVRIPNWLIREIGTVKSNIKWNENKIFISDKNKHLTLFWKSNFLTIGNFSYKFDSNILDIDLLIKSPKLWLGNQEFLSFCTPAIFRIKESVNYQELELKIDSSIFKQDHNSIKEKSESEYQLETLHKSIKLYLSNNILFSEELKKIINTNNEWNDVLIDTFFQYQNHPNSDFRIKLLESLSPILSSEFFVNQLKANYKYFKNNSKNSEFIFDVKRLSNNQYLSLIDLLKTMHIKIDNADATDMSFIQDILSLICEYGKIHPTKFISVRSELIWWQLSNSPTQIRSTAHKEYYNLISGFRSWLGPNSSLTIDRETKEEYTWTDVITFDDNVREKHKNILMNAISGVSLIREAIFLFSNNTIIHLGDIPKNGIWIKHIATENGKSSFRTLIKTINLGTYNIVINLNQGLERDFFEDEIRWLILMGSNSNQNQLVENFGGYWPEESIYTQEYVTDETVSRYLKRNQNEISDFNKRDRWQMRWLHYIWNGVQAYIEFWHRTHYKLAIEPPLPDNLIIPKHDYTKGTRLVSISERKKVTSVAHFYLDLYIHYIIQTESRFPGLKHMADWELIFTATLESMKVNKGIPILKNLIADIGQKEYKSKFKELGLTKDRIVSFIEEFNNFGVLTKPVVFAALRYERWLELNPQAKNEAKASILKELYHDYNLNALLDEYPETRVRYFMMTCLKDSGPDLNKHFQLIIENMRSKKISPWNLNDSIELLIEKPQITENEKFFLARMLYPHINAADFVELVKTKKGESDNLDLVYKTEDSNGNIFSIRPPFQPKEIAKFQAIISKQNLSVTFTVNHEFLLLINDRNNVIGGLYFKYKNNLRVHLEWVVIRKKYQGLKLSKRLMDDFFNRMKQNKINTITVGFYHENFFYKQGFNIDQSYGGLVKRI